MEIRKKILLSLEDYTDFNNFHIRKRLITTPIIIASLILLLVIMGIALGNPGYLFRNSSTAVVLFVCLAISLLLPLQIRFIAKKQYNSSRLRAENEFIIDGTGIRQSSEFGNSNIGWAYLFKAAESKKAYYFYISKAQAFIVPKRYLNPGEAETIRSLVKANLEPKKYKLLEGATGGY